MKHLTLVTFLFLVCHFSMAQFFHEQLPDGSGFGIEFERPDTITSLKAFERNDTSRFLTIPEYENLVASYFGRNTKFEKQRIEDEENIFVCIRFKEEGIWFRYTFWIRLLDDGRPAFRQRIFVDPDVEDNLDENDLLVFQADYHVFEIFDPMYSSDKLESIEGNNILKYIEDLLTFRCKVRGEAWYALDYPEFGYLTSHRTGLYGSNEESYIDVWREQRVHNRLHECYLGRKNITGNSSFFFLCYPIGDVQSLFMTGTPWMQYHQFSKSEKEFSWEISDEVKFMEQRSYYVGLNGLSKRYSKVDFSLAEQIPYLNGFRHGTHIQDAGAYHESFKYIDLNTYVYDELINEVEIRFNDSRTNLSIDENITKYDFSEEVREAKKAIRRYKRHCRKWNIARAKRK